MSKPSPCPSDKAPLVVLLTGAAGQIAYSLLPLIARGDTFGDQQPVELRLLDIEPMMGVMQGVVMELEDCAYPLLTKVVASSNEEEAFRDVDVALLVGAMPRKEGMERKDLLRANIKIFRSMGKTIEKVAKKTCKILVVGNPANTNCYITRKFAPSLPDSAFSCLTRLDHNRALGQVALKLGISTEQVANATIWGNHSTTQYPDLSHAVVYQKTGDCKSSPALVALNDDHWVKNEFITVVQKRGGAVIAARKLSSAMSAARAISDHMHDWFFGTGNLCDGTARTVSMGIVSDGSYGIEKGLIYSFPVTISNGVAHVMQGLSISDFSREKMTATERELQEERTIAEQIVAEN